MDCKFDGVIPIMMQKIDKIDKRTEKLLSMKNMIVGGSLTVAFLWSAVMVAIKFL